MSKVRVYEVAKQLNLDPKAVVGLFQAVGINDVRNHMSSVDTDAMERVKRHLEKQKGPVVEERIRPGVLKRRAVVKSGAAEAPPRSPAVPAAVPSARISHAALPDDRESTRALPDAHNGHAVVAAARALRGSSPAGARVGPRGPAGPDEYARRRARSRRGAGAGPLGEAGLPARPARCRSRACLATPVLPRRRRSPHRARAAAGRGREGGGPRGRARGGQRPHACSPPRAAAGRGSARRG